MHPRLPRLGHLLDGVLQLLNGAHGLARALRELPPLVRVPAMPLLQEEEKFMWNLDSTRRFPRGRRSTDKDEEEYSGLYTREGGGDYSELIVAGIY